MCERKCKKIYIFQWYMKICSFAIFMHMVIKTTCMIVLFNIPLCGENYDTCIIFLHFLGNKMLHRPPSGPPRPRSLLVLPHFLFACSILLVLSFVLTITKISEQMAMRKSIHDMGLLPDTQNWGCACAGNAGNVFPVTTGKRSWHASRHVRHARAVMHAGIAN